MGCAALGGRNNLYFNLKTNKQNGVVDMALSCSPHPPYLDIVIIPRCVRMPDEKPPHDCTNISVVN